LKRFNGLFSINENTLRLDVDGCELSGMNDHGPDIYDNIERTDDEGDTTLRSIIVTGEQEISIQTISYNYSGKTYNYTEDGKKYSFYKSLEIMNIDVNGILSFNLQAYDKQGNLLDEVRMVGSKI
jgi:hypothetical protein